LIAVFCTDAVAKKVCTVNTDYIGREYAEDMHTKCGNTNARVEVQQDGGSARCGFCGCSGYSFFGTADNGYNGYNGG
jgi:hypothetical protein